MRTQSQRGIAFRALHEREGAFIIPNPWDAGTARLLEHFGFEALATTSAGYAFSAGTVDGAIGRDKMIEHVRNIVSATDLPVSADLENGFDDDPRSVADTIRLAAEAGAVGGSIEDVTSRKDEETVYSIEFAAERVRAAVEAARSLEFPFVLTARAENYIVGRPDLKDTIKRLQAYQEAGADVLFAPGLTTREDITAVVESVDRPVNVIMGLQGAQFTLSELSDIGVKRISVGSALSRAALGAFINAAREMLERGTFEFAIQAVGYKEVNDLFRPMKSVSGKT